MHKNEDTVTEAQTLHFSAVPILPIWLNVPKSLPNKKIIIYISFTQEKITIFHPAKCSFWTLQDYFK